MPSFSPLVSLEVREFQIGSDGGVGGVGGVGGGLVLIIKPPKLQH